MFERATAHLSLPWLVEAGVLLVCLVSPAPAQIAVDHWTTDNGLPINSTKGICQSPEGYLWLATFDGLVRFDGVRFTTFNKTNAQGIKGNRFHSMLCNADGDFWAASEGSGITHYHHGRFDTYTVRNGLASDNISGISGDDGGNFWVLARGRLSRWNVAEQRFVSVAQQQYSYLGALSSDGRGVFYGMDQTGLHLFAHGERSHYALPGGWPRGSPIMVGENLDKRILLATRRGKLAQLLVDGWSSISSGAAKGYAHFLSDHRDSHGRVWHYDSGWDAGEQFVQFLILPSGAESQRIQFNTLFEDREGNIWLSTDGQGLYRIRPQIVTMYSKEQGLPARNIYPILQSRDGAVWIGTWSGGLCRFRDGKFATFTVENGLASNRVNAIGEDRDGTLWVAAGGGPQRIRGERFESVNLNGIRSSDNINAIHQDPQGVMWFGTSDGLIRLKHGEWTVLTRSDGLATEDVRVIIDGRDGGLWVGGYGGLSRLRDGQVQGWTEVNGLVSNAIRALYESADGVLWIGTYDGGLGRFENGRFTGYTIRDGLFDNGVFQILEDSGGNLWMSCNRGIYRVSKRQLNDFAAGKTRSINSVEYGSQDGMRNIECNGGLSPAGIKTRDGRLWFPTQDGVAVIDPEKLPTSPPPPPAVIELCLIDHSPVAIKHPVRVTPGHENLEIQYTALSLIHSQQIRFRYQLEGLDRDWVMVGTRRTAYYSHVPPGSYTFKVAAAHGDGAWNEAVASLSFVILPPFYRTWWFASLLSLIALTSLWLGWRYRLGQLERAQAAQQIFSRQLIASQESERKRIAGELHDSLGQQLLIIKNWATLALRGLSGNGGSEVQRRQAALPNEESSAGFRGACGAPFCACPSSEPLMEISTTASQAIDEVRAIAYNLRPYQLEKLGLTAAIQDLVDQIAASSAIRFSTEVEGLDGAFPKDVEISIYRMVQESLNNTVRHSEATEAGVLATRQRGLVKVTIQDNGRGFTAPPAGATASGRNGFGLLGIAERARMLGGQLAIQSAPGAGTTITISLKLQETG